MRIHFDEPFREERNPMARADLHVHSMYSEPPSNWLMQTARVRESYTHPGKVYQQAKERGMTFVTLTDHNRIDGSLLLKEQHPDDVFTGVEATARFPEDGCAIHVLIYGLTEEDFSEVQRLRSDVYQLRDFLKQKDLAHSVAHAAYAVNGRLSLEHLERLILLFDTFETINGGRGRADNVTWEQVLRNLTPCEIERLYRKYRIEPYSQTPWIKGFTGGSDDHAGLFVGRTFTIAQASSVDEFLQALKSKSTYADGRHNDYRSLAFSIGKVVLDHARSQSRKARRSLPGKVAQAVFENKPLPLETRVAIGLAKAIRLGPEDSTRRSLLELADNLGQKADSQDARLEAAYREISAFCDGTLARLTQSLRGNQHRTGVVERARNDLARDLSAFVPAALMAAPFLGTLDHMHRGRELLEQIQHRFNLNGAHRSKRTLCFVDVGDEGLASHHLRQCTSISADDVWIVTSVRACDGDEVSARTLNMPPIAELELPNGRGRALGIPSVLAAMERVAELDPDEIYLSTPGPVGLVGLLASRLLGIRCIAAYNPGFLEAYRASADVAVAAVVEKYANWFYSTVDEIDTPVTDSAWAHPETAQEPRAVPHSMRYNHNLSRHKGTSAITRIPLDTEVPA